MNDCEALAPDVKVREDPEVEFPIAVFPVEVLILTGAPLIANVPPDVIVAEESPAAFIVPEVAVSDRAPVVIVKSFEAVRSWVEVRDPVLVVVRPVLPIVMLPVFVDVPRLIPPLVEVPVPPSIYTGPPVDPDPDSFPPYK